MIVEDDPDIAGLIELHLKKEGFRVAIKHDGLQALDAIRETTPDLLILDLMVPGLDGLELCKVLRRNERTMALPIIMVTARSEEIDRVVGLEIGADDYLSKPFSPRELMARVRAVLRRTQEKEKPAKKELQAGGLMMDLESHKTFLQGKPIELTSKEWDLLKILMQAGERVLTREYLLETVWDYDHGADLETRTIDIHIAKIRKKISPEHFRIETVKNVGYRFNQR